MTIKASSYYNGYQRVVGLTYKKVYLLASEILRLLAGSRNLQVTMCNYWLISTINNSKLQETLLYFNDL